MPATQLPPEAEHGTSRWLGVAFDLVAAFPFVLTATGATWWLVDQTTSVPYAAVGLYAAFSALILARLPETAPGPGIGWANRVTLGRAALATPVGALAVVPAAYESVGYWWIILLATVVMILDGADGRIARRTGTETDFGARFDMELDAALIMALSILVWASGKVGVWVLLIGAMRYLFVAASVAWPALRGELDVSLRRKWICVVQGIALLVALGPIISPTWASVSAGAALVLLLYSFAVDVRALLAQPG